MRALTLGQRLADPTLRLAMRITVALVLMVIVIGAVIGQLRAALEIDIGLLVGAANGPMIQRSVMAGTMFGALSFGRLLLLSVIGLGIGLALGAAMAWLVIVGMAVAQIVLAVSGAWRLAHQ